MNTSYKLTQWEDLKIEDCQILDVQYSYGDQAHIDAIRLKHPSLKRARWFSESKEGNFYSRYTGRESEMRADGYIIKDPYGEIQPIARMWVKSNENKSMDFREVERTPDMTRATPSDVYDIFKRLWGDATPEQVQAINEAEKQFAQDI